MTYLNHGTVGATPVAVLEEQRRIQDEIERQPSSFLLRQLSSTRVGAPSPTPSRLRVAADAVARALGASGDDLVFVDNATTGANAVFRSLDLGATDEIAVLDLAYGAIANAARYAARSRGAVFTTIATTAPYTATGVADEIDRQLSPQTRLVVIDHIAAESGLLLPVRDIASRCRARGILTLIDGAHAPGSVAVDVESLGVDFFVANLHKWAWAPRSSGVLWARRDHQAWLHPPVISWGLDQGFTAEFDWVGTRDPSAHLTAPFALDLMADFGLSRIVAYNHALAWRAAHLLATRWGVPFDTPEDMVGAMVTVAVPSRLGSTPEDAAALRDRLLFEDGIEVQAHAWRGQLWVRVSAQIYNDLSDIERLAEAVARA